MNVKIKKIIINILVFLLTAIILVLIFRKIHISAVIYAFQDIPSRIWIISLVITLTFPFMSAGRWYLILKNMKADVSFSRCVMIIVGIWPISSVTPSKSGDLLRAINLKNIVTPIIVTGSVLLERLLDFFILGLFSLIGGIMLNDIKILILSLLVIFGILCVLILSLFRENIKINHRWNEKVDQLLLSMHSISKKPVVFLFVLMITVLSWILKFIQTKILFYGVSAEVPFLFIIGALPVAILVGLLPITVSGIGTRDSMFIYLFSQFADKPRILTVSLLYTFFGYWLIAFIGIPFIKKALSGYKKNSFKIN